MNTPLLTPKSVDSSQIQQANLAMICCPLLLLTSICIDTARAEVKFTPNKGRAAEWTTRLSNRKLSDINKYNRGRNSRGYAEQKQIGLCADGSFHFRGDFSGSITAPGVTDMGNKQSNGGRWEVASQGVNSVLKLMFPDGSQASYVLSDSGGKFFLNGRRWLAADAAECKKDKPSVSFSPWTLFFK